MTDLTHQDDNAEPSSPQQSTFVTAENSNGVIGNTLYQSTVNCNTGDSVQNAINAINANDPNEGFRIFWDEVGSEDDRRTVLYGVDPAKAGRLLEKTAETDTHGLESVLALLAKLDDGRLADFMGRDGVAPELRFKVVASLPRDKVQTLLAKLGATDPVLAAELVGQLADAQPAAGQHLGPVAVLAILPAARADRHFLTHLPGIKSWDQLILGLEEEDEREQLLTELSSERLRELLVRMAPVNVESFMTALPSERAVRELNQLTDSQLTPLLVAMSVGRSADIIYQIAPNLAARALAGVAANEAAPRLELVERNRAADIIRAMPPPKASACLQRVRTATAAQLIQRMAAARDSSDRVTATLAALPARLRGALIDRVAINDGATAKNLRKSLRDGESDVTGWHRIDALLTMLACVHLVLYRLGRQYRGSQGFGSALREQMADAGGLWRAIRQSSTGKDPNYRKQRDSIALLLVFTLVTLVIVIMFR
jgi:flagellar motility protein MotE (MotC chaperone)